MMSISNPVIFRQSVCRMISDKIEKSKRNSNSNSSASNSIEDDDIDKRRKMSANIEIGIYNFAVKEATSKKVVKKWSEPAFVTLYQNRLRSLCHNLSHDESFLEQVVNEEISHLQLASMNHLEMSPSRWTVLLEKKMKIDTNKYNSDEQASTDMFQCRKCRSRRCQYYELQTRSADESCTVYVNCLDCGKRWRIN